MERMFFNIIATYPFVNQPEDEQKKYLIDLGVYVKGETIPNDVLTDDFHFMRGGTNYPKFVGQSFKIGALNYILNCDFLNEVFRECFHELDNRVNNLIESRIETIQLQSEILGMSVIEENLLKIKKEYSDALTYKQFKILHKLGFENKELHIDFLKSYLAISWYDLSDYLCGLGNISNYDSVTHYSKYLTLNKILNFLNYRLSENNYKDNLKVDQSHSKNLDDTEIGKKIAEKSFAIIERNLDGSELIFKDDNDMLFDFIVSEYSDVKNNAFFSYLFHYFSENKLLLKNIKSSKLYGNFLIKNKFIDKFSKVIQTNEYGGFEKDRLFSVFQDSSKKYFK